ncbi:hypothetical protein N356_gp015 [Cellulophaga phage phi14:2]|uniref:Uncharacterized protein n=1 Tax=Cellulophaga phage phi14:2 TaxID=1327990 RepID=S0A275_9CAUD|nr:hypothetical protein N356_gp015 [Cellulophaga phage phi14:2]AGO48905.1 hypothetical protein Phi14:2_gp027 [Cellulophaga phage phi14:2]
MGTIIGNHKLHFVYENEPLVLNHNQTIEKLQKTTTCVVTENNEENTEVARGTVKLYHKDIDQNVTARHNAFNKAIDSIESRELKGQIIAGYYNSPIKKPKTK